MSLAFAKALATSTSPIIAEIKPASPKLGLLLNGRTVPAIVSDYAAAGVPCLSVTTGAWHHGSIDLIGEMAACGLPILRKDFIVSARHIRESRLAGASAVLLTRTLLRKTDILRLANIALDDGLTPFVEAASRHEIEGLKLPAGSILAVNNRNIRQKETDEGGIGRSLDLYDAARQCHSGLLVSASGLMHPDDVSAVRRRGYDGVLIGSALLSSPLGALAAGRAFAMASQIDSPITGCALGLQASCGSRG